MTALSAQELLHTVRNITQQTNVLLPTTLLGARDRVEVHIAVDRPFVPANLIADSQDTRELGIQVYRATVERSPVPGR